MFRNQKRKPFMRKQRKLADHDSVNDNMIHSEFAEDMKLNRPKFNDGELVEYRYNQDPKSWLPAMILEAGFHNALGHCIYKVFSTEYGYREVHESVLYPIE